MAKSKSRSKSKRKDRKILLAIIMILFVGIVLTTSTYAWFTANRTVTVESIDVQVSTSQGLQISTDASNWKSIVTNSDITGVSWTGALNQIPSGSKTAVPVSTIGNVSATTGLMDMYKGTIDTGTGGGNILIAEKSTETLGTGGDFVVFDLFFQSSVAQTVYLTSNSNVVAKGTSTGIQNAARVAFITEGSVAYGSTPAAAQAIKGEEAKWIWEPNYDLHTAAAVNNALNVYNITTGQTNGTKLAYKGVKAPIAEANDIPLNSTSTDYFADVTTVGSLASGIPTSTYLNAFDVAEGITKVRIYMWIEGQDVDCEDRASGGALTYNLQFSIDANAGS